jgi:hypothetical protein
LRSWTKSAGLGHARRRESPWKSGPLRAAPGCSEKMAFQALCRIRRLKAAGPLSLLDVALEAPLFHRGTRPLPDAALPEDVNKA